MGICEFDLNNNFFKDCSKTAIDKWFKGIFGPSRVNEKNEETVSNIFDKTKNVFQSLAKIFKKKFPLKLLFSLENKINRDLILDTIDLIEFVDRGQIEFIESSLLESTYILPSKNAPFYKNGFILIENRF